MDDLGFLSEILSLLPEPTLVKTCQISLTSDEIKLCPVFFQYAYWATTSIENEPYTTWCGT